MGQLQTLHPQDFINAWKKRGKQVNLTWLYPIRLHFKEDKLSIFVKELIPNCEALIIPYYTIDSPDDKISAEAFLDSLPKQALCPTGWLSSKSDRPEVSFVAAYGPEAFYLKFYINEEYFKSEFKDTHDPVSRDSCVEFFVSIDQKNYYNFEFNALGTCLAAYGADRDNREKLPLAVVDEIKRSVTWQRYLPEESIYEWELFLVIPFSALCFSDLKGIINGQVSANFYKCGDDLEEPHYLSWNPVRSESIDFHQPAYFGRLCFSGKP